MVVDQAAREILQAELAHLLRLAHCRPGEAAVVQAIQDSQLDKVHRWDRQLLPAIQLAVVVAPVIPAPVDGIREPQDKDLEVVLLGVVHHMPVVVVVEPAGQEELDKAAMLEKVAWVGK